MSLALQLGLATLLQVAPPVARTPDHAVPRNASVRIGDLTHVKGIRENALWGTGLVVGLNDTGDSANATRQALRNLLEKQNLNLSVQDLDDGSAALVMVTATLPPFSREGDRIDVRVAATGGAESLFGGTLLFTPLTGADGEVYAVAQGPVTVGGFTAQGAAASVTQNHPTVGQVTNGATIEVDVLSRFLDDDDALELRLRDPDFVTASRIVDVVNMRFPDSARSADPSMIEVRVPDTVSRHGRVQFVAEVSALRVEPNVRARIIVNEKTGTIIAGQGVTIDRVAIAHGNLTVTVTESPLVSQPYPDSNGVTTTVPRTDVQATVDGGAGVTVLGGTATISELAAALNALGSTPRDLITILQNLHDVGALHAELEIR